MDKIHHVKGNNNQTELKKYTDTFQKKQEETLKIIERRLKVRRAYTEIDRKRYMHIFGSRKDHGTWKLSVGAK